jgi:uncharacterized protein
MRKFLKTCVAAPVRLYGIAISPLFGRTCRFHPSCSGYALEAIERYGALKGLFLTARRILKCHPWHRGHYADPVPESFAWRSLIGYKRAQEKHGQ